MCAGLNILGLDKLSPLRGFTRDKGPHQSVKNENWRFMDAFDNQAVLFEGREPPKPSDTTDSSDQLVTPRWFSYQSARHPSRVFLWSSKYFAFSLKPFVLAGISIIFCRHLEAEFYKVLTLAITVLKPDGTRSMMEKVDVFSPA